MRLRWEAAARASVREESAAGTGAPLPLLEGRVAFETDTAFTQLFGDVHAAQVYLVSLIVIVSSGVVIVQVLSDQTTSLISELEAMTELAMRSKAHWGYDDAFMQACRPVLTPPLCWA